MKGEKTWAHCPTCAHTQRFQRAHVNHGFHAVMTVLTLGLWAFSWMAVWIGHRFAPWRCRQCGSNAPDFSRVVVRRRSSRGGDDAG